MNARYRRGFTLIELLVVVVIISMIVALLVPAVLGARGRARITQCMNNEKEIATALIDYDTAKGHLPGYANQVGTGNSTGAESWVAVILPFLGRNDLWEGTAVNGWRSGNPDPTMSVRLNQLVCPTASANFPSSLTYAVSWQSTINSGDQLSGLINSSSAAIPETGVFRDAISSTSPKVSLSNVTSPSQRPMLAECVYPIDTTRTVVNSSTTQADRQWNARVTLYSSGAVLTDPVAIRNQLKGPPQFPTASCLPCSLLPAEMAFIWPDPVANPNTTIGAPNMLPPIHAGIVNVAFCDGHVESLADDTLCSVYVSSPITP